MPGSWVAATGKVVTDVESGPPARGTGSPPLWRTEKTRHKESDLRSNSL